MYLVILYRIKEIEIVDNFSYQVEMSSVFLIFFNSWSGAAL